MRVYILCRNDEFQASFFLLFSGNSKIITRSLIKEKFNFIYASSLKFVKTLLLVY